MSAKEGPPDQEDGTIRIPIAKFIDSVDDYLSSEAPFASKRHLLKFSHNTLERGILFHHCVAAGVV